MRRLILFLPLALAAAPPHLHLQEVGPPPPQAQVRELLKAVCPAQFGADPDLKGFWGCKECPEFIPQGLPGPWNVVAIRYGHFTAAGADEAAAAIVGCEPHSQDFGGTAIFARTAAGLKLRRYEPGITTSDCFQLTRRSGRDLLVCTHEHWGQGMAVRVLYTVDLRYPAKAKDSNLLLLTDTINTCGYGGEAEHIIQRALFAEIGVDGTGVIRAKVSFGSKVISAADSATCIQDFRKAPVPARYQPTTKSYELKFLFDGETVTLDPASLRTKLIIEADPYRGQ